MDPSDDLALVCSLAGLDQQQTSALETAGWSVTRLATLEDCDEDLLRAVIWRVQQKEENFVLGTDLLKEVIRRSVGRAKTRHLWDAKRGAQELLDAHVSHQREVRRKAYEETVTEDVKRHVEAVGAAKRSRWPTKLSLKLHIASGDLALRERAEREERDRWLAEIKEVIKAARLPVALRSSEGSLMIRVAKGRRPNTLRHIKTWAKAGRWLDAVFGKPWPQSPEQFAEFIEAMVEEPCSRSFPESVYKALMFLEYAGEVPEADQNCRSPAVKNVLEEASLRLQTVELKPWKQALLLPVSVVIAWEIHVCNEDETPYARVYAWFRLVKLWTGMRFDDAKGTTNRSMEVTEWGLRGVISRSKTSGPGKRILYLPFYVSKGAWLSEKSWLMVGWRLWNSMSIEAGLLTRDFMLPWPNWSRTGFVRKMVPIASAMS